MAGYKISEWHEGITKRSWNNPHDITTCKEPRKSFNCNTQTINTYRTIGGTCNNLRRPLIGASLTPFRRLLPAKYENGVSKPIGARQQLSGDFFNRPWPSARHLSEQITSSAEVDSDQLTHMHMQWGQFLDHDIDLLGMFEVNCTEVDNDIEFCFPIKVKDTDKEFGVTSVHKARDLPFTRSLPICQARNDYYNRHYNYHHTHHQRTYYNGNYHNYYYYNYYYRPKPREHVNRITHFIDASMVYGSDKETETTLRAFRGGLLKTSGTGKGDLPLSDKKDARGDFLFMAGDTRVNEHTGLVVIQTLFLREHNRIAKELSLINPCWDDEKLYQETRKIIGAIIQIITYKEYLPALYGDKWFQFYIGNYRCYSSYKTPTITNVFATAPFRFGHSQIRNDFSRLGKLYKPLSVGPLELADGFFNPSEYYNGGQIDPILRGLVVDRATENDEFISEGVASLLLTGTTSILANDLAALNIQRGRDHAIPPYRTWEKFCVKKFQIWPSFARLETVRQFKRLYGYDGFLRGMDLWLAGLAEKHLDGSSVGPTFACLLAESFKVIRDGDRFWWENPTVFMHEQRSALAKVTLSKVICESSDGIDTIQPNAFKLSQYREKCSSLPKLDLTKWKDYCYSS